MSESLNDDINSPESINSYQPVIQPPINNSMRSIGELLSESFRMYLSNFWKFLFLVISPGVCIGIIVFLIIVTSSFISGFSKTLLIGYVLVFVLLFLVAVFFSVVCQAAVLILIAKQPISLFDAISEGRKVFWGLLAVNLITGALVFLWSFLLIIPGLVMSVYYSLSIWTYLIEGFTGVKALDRSKELIKGYWWAVVARISVLTIIYIFLVLISLLISDQTIKKIYNSFVRLLFVFITPFFAIYSYTIFSDLKRIKGESSMENRQGSKVLAFILIFIILGIIIILPTLAIFSLNNAKTKVSSARDLSNFKMVEIGLELYYSQNNSYPENLSELKKEFLVMLSDKDLANFKYTKKENNYKLCFDFKEDTGMYKKGENCVESENSTIPAAILQTPIGISNQISSTTLENANNSIENSNNQVVTTTTENDINNPITNPNIDSDNDGLTDQQEKIYGTDAHNPDTDGDGYSDGSEVSGGYNPLGPGKLIKE